MSSSPLFKDNRDLIDFFIALLVIAFFLWLFGFSGLIGRKLIDLKPDVIALADGDRDGIPDDEDKCPLVFGTNFNGCPVDTDGDGVWDHEDECPNLKGQYKGCPPVKAAEEIKDTDGDGVADANDKCPRRKGDGADGCPLDRDNDGVADKDDRCPDVVGSAANDGCPELKLLKEDKVILERALRDVRFTTGSAQLLPASNAVLDKVISLMEKYPKSILHIDGHTDNRADKQLNLDLSRKRAIACKNYLMNNGIDGSRILARGFGESRPKASNDTEEGRLKNRRVEFDLNY